jgi:hypothetical protein
MFDRTPYHAGALEFLGGSVASAIWNGGGVFNTVESSSQAETIVTNGVVKNKNILYFSFGVGYETAPASLSVLYAITY